MDADYRIFKRKLYERILNWKQTKEGKTALLIKGARRVGKSTIAEEFAKRDIPNRKRVTSVTAVTCDFKVFHTLAQLTEGG